MKQVCIGPAEANDCSTIAARREKRVIFSLIGSFLSSACEIIHACEQQAAYNNRASAAAWRCQSRHINDTQSITDHDPNTKEFMFTLLNAFSFDALAYPVLLLLAKCSVSSTN